MSGGGLSFMSSIRLLPFRTVVFTFPVRRRSFSWIWRKRAGGDWFVFTETQSIKPLKQTWSLLEGTTADTDGGTLEDERVGEPRSTELATWTTLVTVMVCLMGLTTDGLVVALPNDGSWFSWFKTNVVVDGWGFWGIQHRLCFIAKITASCPNDLSSHPDCNDGEGGGRLVASGLPRLSSSTDIQRTDRDRLQQSTNQTPDSDTKQKRTVRGSLLAGRWKAASHPEDPRLTSRDHLGRSHSHSEQQEVNPVQDPSASEDTFSTFPVLYSERGASHAQPVPPSNHYTYKCEAEEP